MQVAICELRDAHAAHTRNLVTEYVKRGRSAMTAEVSVEWLVLHQGRNAAVVKRDGGHFNAGSPVTDYLIKVYDRLVRQGLLTLGEPSAGGHRRVEITTNGRARYEALVTGAHSPASGADL